MSAPAIDIRGMWVSYNRRPVLRDVNLSIAPGQVIGVMGPNGAGKSTLLKAMLGLVPPDRGRIQVFGSPFGRSRHRISYVPQSSTVDWDFPVIVSEVAMMGRYRRIGWLRRPGGEDHAAVKGALEKVEMAEYAGRQIGQLSGGQRQRVFLARAIAQQADIVMLDEPFVGVDAKTEETLKRILREMKAEGKTILAVNHDLNDVIGLFDSLILLNQHVVAFGPTSEVFTERLIAKTYGPMGAVPLPGVEIKRFEVKR